MNRWTIKLMKSGALYMGGVLIFLGILAMFVPMMWLLLPTREISGYVTLTIKVTYPDTPGFWACVYAGNLDRGFELCDRDDINSEFLYFGPQFCTLKIFERVTVVYIISSNQAVSGGLGECL